MSLDSLLPLDPSDIALLADFVLAIVLLVVFAFGRPRTWFRDRLGWVILYNTAAIVALLFLIVWAIVFGQRLDEVFRFLIAFGLGSALIWKTYAVIDERSRGRLASERPASSERNRTMSTPASGSSESAPLAIGETVSTSSQKVTLGIAKAVVAAVGGALVGGLGSLNTALADDVVSSQEWTAVALAAIIGSGVVAAGVAAIPTTVTRKQ